MSDLIIVIASLNEDIAYPVKERHFCIGIVLTDTEDDRMDEDESVEKIRQGESTIRHEENDEPDESGECLEEPREVVMWCYSWPEEDEEKDDEEGEVVAHEGRVKNVLFQICDCFLIRAI